MAYLIVFLEGIITFVSPCLLPMLPIYLMYFAGGSGGGARRNVWRNALGFVLGFALVFMTLGLFAGSVGALLVRYKTIVNIVAGAVVILFGLGYLGLFRIPIPQGRGGGGWQPGQSLALFFGSAVRHCLFHQLDTLRGRIPGVGASRWPPNRARHCAGRACCCSTRWAWASPSCSARC